MGVMGTSLSQSHSESSRPGVGRQECSGEQGQAAGGGGEGGGGVLGAD